MVLVLEKGRLSFLLAALSGCATTTILGSENPSGNRPPQWADYDNLPVRVHAYGQAATQTEPDATRRIELFVDPVRPLQATRLCVMPSTIQPGRQQGAYAFVAGALCSGQSVVTYATATVLARGLSPGQLRQHLEIVRVQLRQALVEGNNHPEQAHPSWMYGP